MKSLTAAVILLGLAGCQINTDEYVSRKGDGVYDTKWRMYKKGMEPY